MPLSDRIVVLLSTETSAPADIKRGIPGNISARLFPVTVSSIFIGALDAFSINSADLVKLFTVDRNISEDPRLNIAELPICTLALYGMIMAARPALICASLFDKSNAFLYEKEALLPRRKDSS